MEKAAKRKSFLLVLIASAVFTSAPHVASGNAFEISKPRAEIFLLDGQNRVSESSFYSVKRDRNYDCSVEVALESSVAPKSALDDAFRLAAQNKLNAEGFISRHAIDMTNAPAASARNALGFQRNGPWFWRQLRNQKPDMFSAANLRRIKQGRSPLVDDAWVKLNPKHADHLGDKLIHHHIDQGRFASGLPESIHQQLFNLLHNRTLK